MKRRYSIVAILSILLFAIACEKDDVEPDNPFDKIDYGTDVTANDTLNPTSITGLHRNVFLPKCAVPGCHDGHFEPDFRSVQSSYSTLVYAPIVKNNDAGEFTYRVVPGDTALSVLHERVTNCCFVNADDRMPQDNIGTGLPQTDINNISSWILNGAQAANGSNPVRPDLQPVVALYVTLNTTFNFEYSQLSNRVDSLIFNPFMLPDSVDSFYFVTFPEDDITPLADLQVNTLKVSTNKDDFTNAQSFQAVYFDIPGEQPVWLVTVNASAFQAGQTYYMRYYVNDGQHAEDAEFPQNTSIDPYKTYWSFVVTP